MKKCILTTIIIFFSLISLIYGQDKATIGILPFTHVGGAVDSDDANSIQEAVSNVFVQTRRFNIVDRSKLEFLKAEKDLQKSEDFIDGTVVQQSISLGANFLISGHVISVNKTSRTVQRTRSDGSSYLETIYEASMNFTCKVIDVATGQVTNSENFSTTGGSFLGLAIASNTEEAFNSSLKSLNKDIDRWIGRNFPITFPIVEIQERDKKGIACALLIAGGSASGLEKGDKLKIVEISEMEVNGKKLERRKDIGEIKVSKVEDENFSLCSISSGGIDIESKLTAKAKLIVTTIK